MCVSSVNILYKKYAYFVICLCIEYNFCMYYDVLPNKLTHMCVIVLSVCKQLPFIRSHIHSFLPYLIITLPSGSLPSPHIYKLKKMQLKPTTNIHRTCLQRPPRHPGQSFVVRRSYKTGPIAITTKEKVDSHNICVTGDAAVSSQRVMYVDVTA